MRPAVKGLRGQGGALAAAPSLRLLGRLGRCQQLRPRLPGAAVRRGTAAAGAPPPTVAAFRSRRVGASTRSQDGAGPGSNGAGPVKWVMERGPNTLHSVRTAPGRAPGQGIF